MRFRTAVLTLGPGFTDVSSNYYYATYSGPCHDRTWTPQCKLRDCLDDTACYSGLAEDWHLPKKEGSKIQIVFSTVKVEGAIEIEFHYIYNAAQSALAHKGWKVNSAWDYGRAFQNPKPGGRWYRDEDPLWYWVEKVERVWV